MRKDRSLTEPNADLYNENVSLSIFIYAAGYLL